MKTIIIHNPCNQYTRYYRNYNFFWDVLTDRLKQSYNVIENRNFEFANVHPSTIFLKKGLNPKDGLNILECEYVIEFEDTGHFYILSVADCLHSAILKEQSNPFLKKVLVSQFNRKELEHHTKEYIHKYEPWIYFQSQLFDLEVFYQKRLSNVNFFDKMYFRGTSLEDRSILSYINSEYLEGIKPIGGQEVYFEDLIKYKIGLSVGGTAEICYRDVEYMAIGIPFIRFNYSNELNPKLIPNYHYIGIDRPNDLDLDRLGNSEHAKLIEHRFLQVKDDKEFLNFISKNARDYYEKYLSLNSSIEHTLNLLNIEQKF